MFGTTKVRRPKCKLPHIFFGFEPKTNRIYPKNFSLKKKKKFKKIFPVGGGVRFFQYAQTHGRTDTKLTDAFRIHF